METEWLPDPCWSTDPVKLDGKRCSQRSCSEPAVAFFYRTVSRGNKRHKHIWFACSSNEHLYHRRIVDGVVECDFTVGSQAWEKAKLAVLA